GPPLHRNGAGGCGHPRAHRRGRRGGYTGVESGGRARRRAAVPRHQGVAVNVAVATMQPRTWVLPFAATLVAMFTMQLSNLGFSPLLPALQKDLQINYTQLGLFTGIYGLLALLLSVPAG